MAFTLSGLRTKVQNKLDNTGISTTKIDNWINDAQREAVEGWRLPFFETTQAYTLTVGDADITSGSGLPSTFDRPIAVRITTAEKEKALKYIQYDVLIKRYPDFENADTGTPRFWYEFSGDIKVFPEPDTAFTVDLDYFKEPTELTADGDIPELPSQYEELLVIGAYIRGLEHDDDYDQATVQRIIWDQKHLNMLRKSTQKPDGPTIMGINRRVAARHVRG